MEEYLTVSAELQELQTSFEHRKSTSPSRPLAAMPAKPIPTAIQTQELYYTYTPLNASAPKPESNMDMRHIDFLSTLPTMKQLLHPPDSSDRYFAIHTMNNTLLVDELPMHGLESYLTSANQATEDLHYSTEVPVNNVTEHVLSTVIPTFPGLEGLKELGSQLIPSVNKYEETLPREDARHLTSFFHAKDIRLGSSFLPPPQHYMPSTPIPTKQVHLWQLNELRLALGSDLVLCTTQEHPCLTVKTLDTTRELEYRTCLDLYLDNIMANIPELALCLHSKGFIRGLHLCAANDIPYLNHSLGASSPVKEHSEAPMFDPKLIEVNASTILRFLKENCSKDSNTYILRRSTSEDALQIYDLTTMSNSQQRRWKWLLAMVSHRFAVRLGHHMHIGSRLMKHQIRERQLKLFTSSHQLLNEIQALGGDGHATIQASLLEQMADINLAKVDEHTVGAAGRSGEAALSLGRNDTEAYGHLDEDFSINSELKSAFQLILRAIDNLSAACRAPFAEENMIFVGEIAVPADGEEQSSSLVNTLEVLESLGTQLAGLIHKLVHVMSLSVNEALKSAYIAEGLTSIAQLVEPLRLWNQLRLQVFQLRRQLPRVDTQGECTLWGADKTVKRLFPIVWSALGELMREVCRQTSGVSAHSTRESVAVMVGVFVAFTESCCDASELKAGSHVLCTLYGLDLPEQSALPVPRLLKAVLLLLSTSVIDHSPLRAKGYRYFTSSEKSQLPSKSVVDMPMTDELYILLVMTLSYNCAAITQLPPPTVSSNQSVKPSTKQSKTKPAPVVELPSSIAFNSCLRRLAASCSQLGQSILSTALEANCTPTSTHTSEVNELLALAHALFYAALEAFESVDDRVNVGALTCNIVSVLRLQANWINHHGLIHKNKSSKNKPQRKKAASQTSSKVFNATVIEVLSCLHRGLEFCELGHAKLTRAHHLSTVWNNISSEKAQTLLAIGLTIKASTPPTDMLAFYLEQEAAIVEPWMTAMSLYKELNNEKQVAAVNFQLGSFYCSYWSVEIGKTNQNISKALQYYSEAHRYYSQYDVGPVLIQILTDMADLYISAFTLEEDTFRSLVAPTSTLQLSSELIVSLLGGAYHALIDSRYAFTDVVIGRYRPKMPALAEGVSLRIGKVLLKLLSTHYLETEGKSETVPFVKAKYKELMDLQTGINDANNAPRRLYEILEALYRTDVGLSPPLLV